MLIDKTGDILNANENIICHQCNTKGIFGGGLAYQIKMKYPNCELSAINHVRTLRNKCDVVGTYNIYNINGNQEIVNCFTQLESYDTDYGAIKNVFGDILEYCKTFNKTIAVPYKYGSGIANGNWDIIRNMFEKLSDEYDVDINVYRLGSDKE